MMSILKNATHARAPGNDELFQEKELFLQWIFFHVHFQEMENSITSNMLHRCHIAHSSQK